MSAKQIQDAEQRTIPEVTKALHAASGVEAAPADWNKPKRNKRAQIDYFYLTGSLLVAHAGGGVDAVHGELDKQRIKVTQLLDGDDPNNKLPAGISMLQTSVGRGRTPDLVTQLQEKFGKAAVAHEHAFAVTGWVMCPATEPAPVPGVHAQSPGSSLWPPVAGDPAAGAGARISVVDTGLLDGVASWAPWLTGVTPGSAADIELPDEYNVLTMEPVPDGFADPYAGHGSFIAGVIKCVAPGADVRVERMLLKHGLVRETSMVLQLQQALDTSPDIISMSAGGYTLGDDRPLALQALWQNRSDDLRRTVMVSAAGNDGSDDRLFWPAAFDWCVGVGSTDQAGANRSWFSNFGKSANVYAPGEDIVNAYPQLPYMAVDGTQRDTSAGIVSWSGTSFATPIVAAAIAKQMTATGQSARAAANAVLAQAQANSAPGIGPRVFP